LERELRSVLYKDHLIMRLSRIALAAHASDLVEAADALNRACDYLGQALDLLGPNRRRKGEQEAASPTDRDPGPPPELPELAESVFPLKSL
jgi:hypothetical protein